MRSRSYAVSIRIAGSWDGLHEAQRLNGGIAGIPTSIRLLLSRAHDRSIGIRADDVAPAALIG